MCRVRLFEVLLECCGRDSEDARIKAGSNEGFGPNFYRRSEQNWHEMLGKNGNGIYLILKVANKQRKVGIEE